MEDFELTLFDRIEIIKTTNKQYDLENNAYISFSGGRDSTILHYLIDMALPNNKIPRVYINTGIEYNDIVAFVNDMQSKDERIIVIKPQLPIKQTLEKYGYPFKSKQHSNNLRIYQNNGMTKTNEKYLGMSTKKNFLCPKQLHYQFTPNFKIKCSDRCCFKLKKEPAREWEINNKKTILITGMRSDEGEMRKSQNGCIILDKQKNLTKFHPLKPINDMFAKWFVQKFDIKLCKLYYPPYNFERTGCKGCPFNLNLQNQLELMEKLLPIEKKQCEIIWKPIYEEYRRIGYRLKSEEQMTLDDYLE